jgi:hypothetical protein
MALIFEPDRVVYDPDKRLLRLFATDGLRLVQCAISRAALTALEDDALAGPDAMAATYRRNMEKIEEIADCKYRNRRYEDSGAVVVRLQDVTSQAAPGQSPAADGQLGNSINYVTYAIGDP